MRLRAIFTFIVAIAISLVAATYEWGDSSHAIGMVSANGGKSPYPSVMQSGHDLYTQVVTATVLPPYRGDMRVVLEGPPLFDWEIRYAAPVIDLGFRRQPVFKDNILHNVEPGDRPSFWVLLRPLPIDPVCGMTVGKDSPSTSYNGKTWHFCCTGCRAYFQANPQQYTSKKGPQGKYTLAFYDTQTGHAVLKLPLIIKGKESSHAPGRQH